jgi:hypothetical protein
VSGMREARADDVLSEAEANQVDEAAASAERRVVLDEPSMHDLHAPHRIS